MVLVTSLLLIVLCCAVLCCARRGEATRGVACACVAPPTAQDTQLSTAHALLPTSAPLSCAAPPMPRHHKEV